MAFKMLKIKIKQRKEYPLLILKLLILLLFVYTLASGIFGIYYYHNHLTGFLEFDLHEYLFSPVAAGYLRPAIIMIIPLIGILINRKIGWILIASYFYFLIFSIAFSAKDTYYTDKTYFVISLIGFIIFCLLVLFLNKMNARISIYKINRREIIEKNIIASILGISITIFVALTKNVL